MPRLDIPEGSSLRRWLRGVPATVALGFPDSDGSDGEAVDAELIEYPTGDVFGGGGAVHHVVQVGVVGEEFVQDGFQVGEVTEHTDLVELGALEFSLDMIAVTVEPGA